MFYRPTRGEKYRHRVNFKAPRPNWFTPYTTTARYISGPNRSITDAIGELGSTSWLSGLPLVKGAVEAVAAKKSSDIAIAPPEDIVPNTPASASRVSSRRSARNPDGAKDFPDGNSDDENADKENDAVDDDDDADDDIGASPLMKTPRRQCGSAFSSAPAAGANPSGKKRPTPPSKQRVDDPDNDDTDEGVTESAKDEGPRTRRTGARPPATLRLSEDGDGDKAADDESMMDTQTQGYECIEKK